MTRRVRLPLHDLAVGTRRLAQTDAHYLLRVRRLAVKDAFVAFDPKSGIEAEGVVLDENGNVEFTTTRVSAKEPDVIWIHGLAKGDKCDAIVRDATELGATRVVFAKMARSIVDLKSDRGEKRLVRWEKIADEAARQSERSRAPTIALASWDEALVEAADLANALRICLYEAGTTPLAGVLTKGHEHYVFATGPEGGFELAEIEAAERAGFIVASLGARILRTETVPAAVLGALQFVTLAT